MSDAQTERELLVKVRGLKIEGRSGEQWNQIVNGVDLDLQAVDPVVRPLDRLLDRSIPSQSRFGRLLDDPLHDSGHLHETGLEVVELVVKVPSGHLVRGHPNLPVT